VQFQGGGVWSWCVAPRAVEEEGFMVCGREVGPSLLQWEIKTHTTKNGENREATLLQVHDVSLHPTFLTRTAGLRGTTPDYGRDKEDVIG
jgi:hypothetical protein